MEVLRKKVFFILPYLSPERQMIRNFIGSGSVKNNEDDKIIFNRKRIRNKMIIWSGKEVR